MTTQTSKNEIPLKHEKKERKNNTALITSTTVKVSKNEYSETEKSLINVNNLALEGKIESIYENKKIYETIFDTFAKRNKNNVIIVGDDGIGKTSTVMNIANKLINYDVPSMFKNRVLMQIDFNSLISGMGIRGIFEAKGKAIIEDARNKNKFIFFIDDIQTILNDKGRFSDVGVDSFIENIINEKNILLIATTTPKGYSNLSHTNSSFKQKFNVIKMDEMTQDECIEAFMCIKNKLENYHNINISRECVETCVKLCKRYMNDRKLPEVIVDMMDEIGASYSIKDYTNDNIEEIEKQLLNCLNDKEKAKLSTDKDSFNEVDKLTIREINLRSKLNVEQKIDVEQRKNEYYGR